MPCNTIHFQKFTSAGYNVMYPFISRVHEVQITIQVSLLVSFTFSICSDGAMHSLHLTPCRCAATDG